METNKHYLRVGAFVLLLMVGIALFAIWMAGTYDKSRYTTYRIHFAESVSGLAVGGPVKFRGLQVGRVEHMIIDPDDTSLIRVDISALKTTPIKTDTLAGLKLQGITGAVYIELSSGSKAAPLLMADNSDNPPEIASEPSTLNTVMDIMPAILQKVSHIAEQVDKLFNDKNIAAIGDTLEQLQKTSHEFNQLSHNLKEDPSKLIIPPREKGIPAP